MNLVFRFLSQDGTKKDFSPKGPVCAVGAEESNDWVLDEASVSSFHARLAKDDHGTWSLEDLGSTNGTFVNGEVVEGRVLLHPGDVVEFGQCRVEVLAAVADAPQAPAAKSESAEFKWNARRLMDLGFDLCGKVHGFFAWLLPLVIGKIVRLQSKVDLRARLTAGFLVLAALSAWVGWGAIPHYLAWTDFTEDFQAVLVREGLVARGNHIAGLGKFTAMVCLALAGLAWVRRKFCLWAFKGGVALFILLWLYLHGYHTDVPAVLHRFDPNLFGGPLRNEYWLRAWIPWLFALGPPLLMALATATRVVRETYAGEPAPTPLVGDRVFESLRTGGRDPRMRSSSYWSTFFFVFALALPFLLSRGCGWEDPYGIPKGSGEPVVEMVRVTRQRERPERRMIVNQWSPYIFERMQIDDIKILDELEEHTLNTYEIAQEQTGRLGEGGGDKGGWPDGMEGTRVRFIRLQYSGGDWDQNMDRNSDANLLRRFSAITGFDVASDGEGIRPERLRRFPPGRKPPFVFMTGRGNINFSESEIRTLRWYTLEEGGMIFATHGGGNFDRNFRNQLNRIFPGSRLVDIPNDDPIYRAPFVFPNGAPPLWQQAGSRSLGIRHEGRWVVFYHPGDMSDAWRDGHSGAAPEVAEQAYRMAINVMYHAFNMYHARHYQSGR